ncbi:MAG: hypothetical protein DSY55_03065 [Clostridia bacterium]|nr:MAG: hypothetical protein DSY55_03065 [Clostridia bacterium]
MLTPLAIGRFRIEKGIGQGGMGIVYRAYDTVLQRPVALKLLGTHLSGDEQALARFRREAETLIRLKHSNIALVYDFGEHEGRPYIAMEWVDGRTLKDILQEEGRMPLGRGLHILEQIANALDYAHHHGIIHRDIKPANILIDDHDHATLVDFGVAWWDEAPSLTTTGVIVGTPLYMSPEQLLGQPLDGRSDLYSLAVIAYEMFGGSPPFCGGETSTPAVIHQQLYLPPPPLLEQNPAMPEHVGRALEKAMSKLPADRFATGADFIRALRSHPVKKAPPSFFRRKKTLWAGVAGVLLVVLALSAFWQWGIGPSGGGSNNTPDASLRAASRPTSSPAPTISPTPADDSPAIPIEEPDGGNWQSVNGNERQFRYHESAIFPLAAAPRWHYQASQPLKIPLIIVEGQLFFPEGDAIQILNWRNGEPAETPSHLGASITAPLAAWLDEDFLLFASTEDDQLYALDGYNGALRWRLNSDAIPDEVLVQAVTPDGALYLSLRNGDQIGVDPADGETQFSLSLNDNAAVIQPPGMTATGVYLLDDQNTLTAMDADSHTLVWQTGLTDQASTPALPLEEAGVLAVGEQDGGVQALSVLSGEERWRQSLNGSVTGLAYNYERLFVTTAEGWLYALQPEDGVIIWEQHVTSAALLPPLVNDVWVLTLSDAGVLTLSSVENGDDWPEAGLDLGLSATQPPVFVGGWLFVQNEEGVWAFGPQEASSP